MKYRIFFLFLFICASLGCYNFFIHPAYPSTPISIAAQKTQKILLVPLDGRPPCRQFVLDAGELAGAEILTPPGEIQDYYTQPGDTKALGPWLESNISGCDAVILSIDQLLYGGLLAAREANKTPAEMTAMLDFLRRLHAELRRKTIRMQSCNPSSRTSGSRGSTLTKRPGCITTGSGITTRMWGGLYRRIRSSWLAVITSTVMHPIRWFGLIRLD